ncbi:MAG TPA: 4Fe-4S double cluster binding domain-containing protein [Clostridia bacterium]|nr:4Fe-4S double cluster binding domain-containing protein [Clostridia bacterium]
MRDTIVKAAREHGFAAAYFLAPLPLPRWRDRASLSHTASGMDWDVPSAFPKATCVVLLVGAYLPYAREDAILPYYIAENKGYFEAKTLAKEIAAEGFYCESAWLPARALALENGVGSLCRSGLLTLPEYGTRTALFTLATDACGPCAYEAADSSCPKGCDLCARACPTGAISESGLDATKCLRYHMDGAAHPLFVLEKMTSFLGCDICQRVCPHNAVLEKAEPSEETCAAFDLRRLILGETKQARALVGRNVTGGGKLTVEAIALAARERMYEAEIRAALASPHPAVRETARWALEKNF